MDLIPFLGSFLLTPQNENFRSSEQTAAPRNPRPLAAVIKVSHLHLHGHQKSPYSIIVQRKCVEIFLTRFRYYSSLKVCSYRQHFVSLQQTLPPSVPCCYSEHVRRVSVEFFVVHKTSNVLLQPCFLSCHVVYHVYNSVPDCI